MGLLAPKPGDECMSCADYWDNHNPPKPRQKLVKLPSTQNNKLLVTVCPYCDGELVINLPKPGKSGT